MPKNVHACPSIIKSAERQTYNKVVIWHRGLRDESEGVCLSCLNLIVIFSWSRKPGSHVRPFMEMLALSNANLHPVFQHVKYFSFLKRFHNRLDLTFTRCTVVPLKEYYSCNAISYR